MMRTLKLAYLMIIFCAVPACAQIDYHKHYLNAKTLYREGKYNLAMETFKPLIAYDKNNPYSQYASFYYALAAYNQGFKPLAKTSLNEIKKLSPAWDKMDEVNFWIGKINMEDRDYFQGLKVWSTIQDKSLQPLIEQLKTKSISEVTDLETLRMMREENPRDAVVGKQLATQLAKNSSNPTDKAQLDELIRTFNLNRADFVAEAPKSFFKDIYSVSVMMPFMVNTLEPSTASKRNQNVLDFYEGMKLAVDTLAKQGVKISLRAYDSERNVNKIKSVLNTDELKNTDLLVGPFFQEEVKPIVDFSLTNGVNLFNPLHNNLELLGSNPYAFLYQPSLETMGRKAGEFLSANAKKKTCLIFYGTTRRDSTLAASFAAAAQAKGMKIMATHRLSREQSGNILSILTTATEFDDFKNPKQFALKKDSVGGIYVASDDALIYAKVISGIETRGDQIPVVGSESWLEQHTIDLEKFQNLPITLIAPNYVDAGRPYARAFNRKYVKTHGRVPTNYASTGYELMLFLGNQLKKNGVYFQEAMAKAGAIPGYITEGHNYQAGRSNDLVPFIRFEAGNMKVIDKK
ncbi:ABC transporter substrate-binding protein [Chryseolinea sp. T2]|uniref:ABC transporter substrate-binding protein n=1 Tax=Chryseolinea sp. T2 TaxID=3129255 RepID=UPI003077E3AB